MTDLRSIGPLLGALVLAAVAGLVHGEWTGRWGRSADLDAAVARIARIPKEIEGWRGIDVPLDPRQLEVGEIAGHLSRVYQDPIGGGAVTMLLVCGRSGPISVHTPDICYRGAGFEPQGPPRRVDGLGVPGEADRFWRGIFQKTGPAGASNLAIHWGWSTDGRWDAPDHPRLLHDPRTVLFKLYLIREIEPGVAADDPRAGSVQEFARAFLPALRLSLFSPP